MKLINSELIVQNAGLSEELILEIKRDLKEFQAILNAFKFGNNSLKIDMLLDQKAKKSLSIIENGFETIKRSALGAIREESIFFELEGAQKEKLDASEKLILVSKLLDSHLNGPFSKLTTPANVLAILIFEILIAVTFLTMIILRETPP